MRARFCSARHRPNTRAIAPLTCIRARARVLQHCAHHALFAWRRWRALVARLKLPRRAWLQGRRGAGVAMAFALADGATRRRRAAAFAAWRHHVSSAKVQLGESATALALRRAAMVRSIGKALTRRLLLRPRWVKWRLVCAALRGITAATVAAGQGLHEVSAARRFPCYALPPPERHAHRALRCSTHPSLLCFFRRAWLTTRLRSTSYGQKQSAASLRKSLPHSHASWQGDESMQRWGEHWSHCVIQSYIHVCV